MRFHRVLAALIIILSIFSTTSLLAQNANRLDEEDVKDQERISKYREYINDREKEEKELLERPVTVEELENKNLVEVEPNNILPSDLATVYKLVPYRVRRPRWGNAITATYGLYSPHFYTSDYQAGSFSDLYGSAQTPYLELSYEYKWNFSLGSIGGEVSAGTYSNDAKDAALGDAKLSLQIIRAGAKYTMNNIFYEPLVAPYAIGGVYTVRYKETQAAASFDGTTSAALYYGFGVMFQLGWLDPSAAVDAYTESEIENSYLFIEARQYLASSALKDPDFSTELDIHFGVNVEF